MTLQLKKNISYGMIHHLRYIKNRVLGVSLGKRVWIDSNVRLMRFPGNIQIGHDVVVKEGVKICACNSEASVAIGNNTTIGYYSFFFASQKIEVGTDCMIAPFVYIVDSNHRSAKDMPLNQQPNETAPIVIGNDVWIASKVTILKGVRIGDGAIVAAHSLVNCDIGANEIWAGTPARKIGERE